MANKPIDDIMETLASMPMLHRGVQKNVFKEVIDGLQEGITRHHLEILKLLSEEQTLHMAEIADLLLISKSQMTRLIDELINLEMIERQPDEHDRRKSNILLTIKGENLIETVLNNFEISIKKWLSSLNNDELIGLSRSLKQIRNIMLRLR